MRLRPVVKSKEFSAQPIIVPAINPFSRMGLKTRAPGAAARETPTATWDELVAFRAKAMEQGYQSIATAALVAWEWLQREEHIFGAFDIKHCRPKERSDSVASFTRRPARKDGGRYLTRVARSCSPN